MSLMTTEQFDDFFEPYAANVENFYEAPYWALSDALVKELFRRNLHLEPGQKLLDAGGGTARWALWAAEEFGVEVTVADKSRKMLEIAAVNVAASSFGDQIKLIECDIEAAEELEDSSFDAVISTYGVLSFLSRPEAAFGTISRVLRSGGEAMLMSHSLANALHSKISRDGSTPTEIRELLATQIVRWAPHVPPLRVYASTDLRNLSEQAGLECRRVYGVTTLAYPGPEDFGYPYVSLGLVSESLQDDAYFNAVLEAELVASERTEWADRGVNLLVHAHKPE